MDGLLRTLLLLDFNTRVVVLSTGMLGLAAGFVGSFALLRKRALMGDALSHATLPGIGLAFMVGVSLGGTGRSLPLLLAGALVSGLVGVLAILWIRRVTHLKEDAALGLVLSVFFGLGIAILGVVQQMQAGHAAGLEGFIYGKTASMVTRDAWLIAAAASTCGAIGMSLFKELKLLCFDAEFAGAGGLPVGGLDMILMGLVVAITIVGLQAVGLILVIALLVIPASAARFWTEDMAAMSRLAALIGGISGCVGALASATFPKLPSGAMIVVMAASIFLVSLLGGSARGLVWRAWHAHRTRLRIESQHLARALFEVLERQRAGNGLPDASTVSVALDDLLGMRSWTMRELRRAVRRGVADGLVQDWGNGQVRLTRSGYDRARQLVHEHRLLELYLIEHADVAPARVDHGADAIEHYLDPDLIARLESQLRQREPSPILESPHPLGGQ